MLEGFSHLNSISDQSLNNEIKTNIRTGRFSLKTIVCFKKMIERFEVYKNWIACTNGKKIKVFNHSEKIFKAKLGYSSLFKIVDGTLVFLYEDDSKNKIGTFNLSTGNRSGCEISLPELSTSICVANKRIFGIAAQQFREWDFSGNVIRALDLKENHLACIYLRSCSPRIMHSDQYVVHINKDGIHWFDIQKNVLLEFLPEEKTNVSAYCIGEHFLFLAVYTTNLYDSYLLKIDLETGLQNKIELEFSSFYELKKEMLIRNIVIQGDRIFLRIGKYIVDYERKTVLGSFKASKGGEEPMSFLFDGQMFMYLTHHHNSSENKSIKNHNIRDLTTNTIHSFVCPFNKPENEKYYRPSSFFSAILLEGKLLTYAGGDIILFDFLNPSMDASQDLEPYKDWISDSESEHSDNLPREKRRRTPSMLDEIPDESSSDSDKKHVSHSSPRLIPKLKLNEISSTIEKNYEGLPLDYVPKQSPSPRRHYDQTMQPKKTPHTIVFPELPTIMKEGYWNPLAPQENLSPRPRDLNASEENSDADDEAENELNE